MENFDKYIQDFKRYGSYTYKFDNVGNVVFNSSSLNFNQIYFAFPLENIIYDTSKIEMMYDVQFKEFVPNIDDETTTNIDDVLQQLETVKYENDSLKNQLNMIIEQTMDSNEPTNLSTKQVILELRKALGQGISDVDFSDTFPYTPIKKL